MRKPTHGLRCQLDMVTLADTRGKCVVFVCELLGTVVCLVFRDKLLFKVVNGNGS